MQRKVGKDDNGTEYEFVYLEKEKIILIWKNNELRYTIEIGKKPKLSCSCWGYRRWKHCRHIDFAKEVFNFNRTVKPRSLINIIREEYYLNYIANNKVHGLDWAGRNLYD